MTWQMHMALSPHDLIYKALDFVYVPEQVKDVLVNFFANVKMKFITKKNFQNLSCVWS